MSLPDTFFDDLKNRLPLSRVVGRKVIWDNRKSNTSKGDYWAPCPFHHEKSASFHVDDQKGFYYCFGCHAKGNIFSFVKETENVNFMESVKLLAAEAGVPLPQQDPQAQKKADRNTHLTQVMQYAVNWYRLQLQTVNAGAARDYLIKRDLSNDIQEQWQIGYAPSKGGIYTYLIDKGVAPQDIIDIGLAAKSDRGGSPYERFKDRIMFPILNTQKKPIAFGGRALAQNARAKYLNSPETFLFDKGRTLYNHAPAREAVARGQPLIVAEGYMDVIALSKAGFNGALAPLGTAITETQLQYLWKISNEPIIALDGDTAGLRAAMRLIDLALPRLQSGTSLRFAILPAGLDPDDLIKSQGQRAMQTLIDQAIPMIELLWRRETEGKDFDSPERRAALDKVLEQKLSVIVDSNLRYHYQVALKQLRWNLFSNKKTAVKKRISHTQMPFKKQMPWHKDRAPVASNKNSQLSSGARHETDLRIETILALLLAHPDMLATFETDFEHMKCNTDQQTHIKNAILTCSQSSTIEHALFETLGYAPLDVLKSRANIAINPAIKKAGTIDKDIVYTACKEAFSKHKALQHNTHEIQDALQDIWHSNDERLTWRVSQSAAQIEQSCKGNKDDTSQFETARNGSKIDKNEKDQFTQILNDLLKFKNEP